MICFGQFDSDMVGGCSEIVLIKERMGVVVKIQESTRGTDNGEDVYGGGRDKE